MNLRVAFLPSELSWRPSGAAVVIDVLRATSVIAQAIAAGAAEVIVCGEIDDAFALAERQAPRPLLCGERSCKPITGFDLGNSPTEYEARQIAGKRLIMTTTNGTRAVIAAAGFDLIFAASFTNRSAVVGQLVGQQDVSIICAGTDGERTDEDVLLAGAILHALTQNSHIDRSALTGERTEEALQLWREHLSSGQELAVRLRQTLGGRNLVAAGYERDIEFCATIDSTDAVAVVDARDPIIFRRLLR
jgi:2-phosphosulfolactate phosphatase